MKAINVYYGYIPCNPTIDANLHPDVQIIKLYDFIKKSVENVIEIYCNSPYILNELTVIEGYTHNNIPHPKRFEITTRHFEYLLDGNKVEGKYYKSMISDENLLNNKLAESNEKYSDLLELVQEQQFKNKL